jgi:hypothetical protein
MSSSGRPPRSKYRFGFRGKRSGRAPQPATTDEILDSLTRQAKLMEKNGEERTIGLQTILEVDPPHEPTRSSNLESSKTFERLKPGSLRKFAFAIMLLIGLAFVWVYSRLSQTLNPPTLTMLQQTISRTGFGDWQKIVFIAFCAFVIALLAHRKKQAISR